MADDDVVLGIGGEPDEPSLSAAGERAGKILGDKINQGLQGRLRGLGKTFGDIQAGIGPAKALDALFNSAQEAQTATRQAANSIRGSYEQLEQDTESLRLRTIAMREALESVGANPDLFAVIDREIQNLIASSRRLEEVIDSGDALSPERLKIFETAFERANRTVFREVAAIQSLLKTQANEERITGLRRNQEADRLAQEAIQIQRQRTQKEIAELRARESQLLEQTRQGNRLQSIADREQSQQKLIQLRADLQKELEQQRKLNRAEAQLNRALAAEKLQEQRQVSRLEVVAEREASQERLRVAREEAQKRASAQRTQDQLLIGQRRTAEKQQLEEIRLAGRQAVIAQQAASRSRLAVMKFAFDQIKTLERGLAAVFRTTGSIVASTARVASAGVGRLGNVFRRSNRDLNDGLEGALIQRERSISRSFRRQTTEITSQVARQEQVINRFEKAASTGIAGAVTGRSRLGGLLGGGLAIGGGFVVFDQIRKGFEETVNLNEALNATREIFKDAADDVIAFSETSTEALFLTQSEALQAAQAIGTFGKAAGLTGSELAGFTSELTLLATDLASFRNTTVDEAIGAISSALAGEVEPIRRRYGVLLDQQTLQQRALNEGIIEEIRVLRPAERVLAAYAEIMAQTVDAQGDAARTSQGFANSSRRLQAELTSLFAALLERLIPVAEVIINTLNPALRRLTQFLSGEGELSPALRILRDALIGVGIGLAGLAAISSVTKGFQLLGIALTGVLTPFGLLVTAFAAFGAAITVFARRNENFANALRAIGSVVGDVVRAGLDKAADVLTALGGVLTNTVLPAIGRFVELVSGPFITVLATFIGFIQLTAIPAITRLASLVADNIGPAFRRLGEFLTGTVIPAVASFGQTVGSVLISVIRFIEPAINGFFRLAQAIVRVFTSGDFSGLLSGVRAFASGVGEVFANLGVLIFNALRPQLERLVQFLSGVFDRIDFGRVAASILEVVRIIGFVLGRIVSDPLFIQALEGIVIAAIAVGAKFIQGFAQGVNDNLPDLIKLFANQFAFLLEEAIKFAFRNPQIIAAAVAALFAASAILNAFRAGGQAAGQAASQGLFSRLNAGIRAGGAALSSRNFLLGLFGGAAGLQAQADAVAKETQRNLTKAFQKTNRQLRALGQKIVLIPKGGATVEALAEANRRLDETKTRLGQAGSAAAIFRTSATNAFREVAVIAQSSMAAVRNRTTSELGTAQVAFKRFRIAAGDAFTALRASASQLGTTIGVGVLSSFGAVIGGQQLGQGNTFGGLTGILASAIGAGLSTNSPVVGAAVAGIGLITAAFYASGEEARIAEEKIGNYTEAIVNAGSFAQAQETLIKSIIDSILTLDAESQNALRNLDIRALLDQISRGVDPQVAALTQLSAAFGLPADAATRLAGDLNLLSQIDPFAIAGSAPDLYDRLQDVLAGTGIEARFFVETFQDLAAEGSAVRAALESAGVGLDLLAVSSRNANAALTDPELGRNAARQYEQIVNGSRSAFDEVGQVIGGAVDVIVDAGGDLIDNFGVWEEAGRESLRWVYDWVAGVLRAFAATDVFASGFDEAGRPLDETASKLQEVTIATNGFSDALNPLSDNLTDVSYRTELVTQAIEELNTVRTERVRQQIDSARASLELAEQSAEQAQEALTNFLTRNYSDSAQAQVDALIGNVGSIGARLEDALQQGGVRGDAAARVALGDFSSAIADIVRAGIEEGLTSQEQFRRLLAPIFAVLDEEGQDALNRIVSLDFESGIAGEAGERLVGELNRILSGTDLQARVGSVFDAEGEVSRIQDLLDGLDASLNVKASFDREQIKAALSEAGASDALIDTLDFTQIDSQQIGGLVAAVAAAMGQFGGPATPTGPTNIVEQNNNVLVQVNGAQSPASTASSVIAAANLAIANNRFGSYLP